MALGSGQNRVFLYDANGNPIVFGQATMANSVPVVVASDQTPIPAYRALPSSVGWNKYTKAWATQGGASVNTRVKVYSTTYTEPASGAQRSVVSASANDTAAGTGARTVEITFLDSSFNRQTETVTLNGTTPVNTVSTTIQYIESMVVKTVGSGLRNAGAISLMSTTGGGGSAVASIGFGTFIASTGDNATGYGHHYVPTGKTARVDGMGFLTNSTTGAYLYLTYKPLNVSNAVEIEIGPWNQGDNDVPLDSHFESNLVLVTGPAIIYMNAIPLANSLFTAGWMSVVEL